MAKLLMIVSGARTIRLADGCVTGRRRSCPPRRPTGAWMFDGYRMTAFTDEEEDQTKAGKIGMPWYVRRR
jgi:hypothetical protein